MGAQTLGSFASSTDREAMCRARTQIRGQISSLELEFSQVGRGVSGSRMVIEPVAWARPVTVGANVSACVAEEAGAA